MAITAVDRRILDFFRAIRTLFHGFPPSEPSSILGGSHFLYVEFSLQEVTI
jgi:hypothetical protein